MLVSAPTLTETEASSVATVKVLSSTTLAGACDLAATSSAGSIAELLPQTLDRLPGLLFTELAALQSLPQLLELSLTHWRLLAGGAISILARLYLGGLRLCSRLWLGTGARGSWELRHVRNLRGGGAVSLIRGCARKDEQDSEQPCQHAQLCLQLLLAFCGTAIVGLYSKGSCVCVIRISRRLSGGVPTLWRRGICRRTARYLRTPPMRGWRSLS